MIAFRNNSNAIRRGDLTSYTTDDVCAFTKKSENEEVLVISNLRNKPIDYMLPSTLKNSTWKDVMKGGTIALPDSISLPPYSYLVFKK